MMPFFPSNGFRFGLAVHGMVWWQISPLHWVGYRLGAGRHGFSNDKHGIPVPFISGFSFVLTLVWLAAVFQFALLSRIWYSNSSVPLSARFMDLLVVTGGTGLRWRRYLF
ncbi:hypothetical protein F5144DRAFT_66276 [Chaetomium tenue]|uniref:Uncharacterized protein n=1 Tax=Chaetomium tenue TaxID=1854479 RepID=A0ACB7PR69_9PEZI|nr:hypothetical protein F5144DRAFT_66276 [Chaetomium globosum]